MSLELYLILQWTIQALISLVPWIRHSVVVIAFPKKQDLQVGLVF